MDRAVGVGVIRHTWRELEDPLAKVIHIGNTSIDVDVRVQTGTAGGHELVIVVGKSNGLVRLRLSDGREKWRFRAAGNDRGDIGIKSLATRAEGELVAVHCAVLSGKRIVG